MKDLSNKIPGAGTLLEVADLSSEQKYHTLPAVQNSACDVLILDARLRQSLVTVRSLG